MTGKARIDVLQVRHRVEQRIGLPVDRQRLPAVRRSREVEASGKAASGQPEVIVAACPAVVGGQHHLAGPRRRDRRQDADPVIGVQRQRVARGPRDRRPNDNVADPGIVGHARTRGPRRCGLQRDTRGVEVRADGGGRSSVHRQVGGVDQPVGGADAQAVEVDLGAGGLDLTARYVGLGGGDLAMGDGLTAFSEQDHPAIVGGDASGGNDTAHVPGQSVDIAAIGAQFRHRGLDRPGIGGAVRGRAKVHHELAVVLRHVAQGDAHARQQAHITLGGQDLAVVANRRGRQHHVAPERADGAQIDDRGGGIAGEAERAALQEVRVGNVEGRGDEPAADLDHPVLADDHAVGIEKVDRARGGQEAIDRGDPRSGHPIKGRARAVVELRGLACADGKGAPVDDRLAGLLIDRDSAGVADDRGLARLDRPARRGRRRRRCARTRDERQQGQAEQRPRQRGPGSSPHGFLSCQNSAGSGSTGAHAQNL